MSTPQQQTKDTQASLVHLTVPQLKEKCKALGVPVTGAKAKLISMILDPTSHQKKRATTGAGIKKAGAGITVPKKIGFGSSASSISVASISSGRCGFYASVEEESDSEDEFSYVCEGCNAAFDIDEISEDGLCPGCEDDYEVAKFGVCPGCTKRCPPCEYDEDEGCYVCCM